MYILFIFLYSLCSLYYLMILHLSVPNPRFAEPQSSFPVSHVGCNASVKGLPDAPCSSNQEVIFSDHYVRVAKHGYSFKLMYISTDIVSIYLVE